MLASILTFLAVLSGLASAGAWLYASRVKVSREKALAKRRKEAEKNGEEPYLGGVVFYGAEMKETLDAQSKWNSIGAVLAAIAVASQAIAPLFA